MKICITGTSGVIGSILAEKLDKKYDIISFKGDIRSRDDIKLCLRDQNIDVLFHLAALVPVKKVNEDPLLAYSVNVGGTINLLEEIKRINKKPWIFYASSSHVYKSKETPLSEEDSVSPVSLYGETKWMAEKICIETAKAYNIPICCGRIFSFYHRTQKMPFLYPTIMERLKTEDLSMPLFLHEADSVRDFLNAEDVVNIMIKLMKKKYSGIVNIGSGKGVTIREFVQSLSHAKLKIINADAKKDILISDISKLKSIIESSDE